MLKIAHRGNINGPIKNLENHPVYLMNAISLGYDVEVDLWLMGKNLWFGHDEPQYLVNKSVLLGIQKNAWFHCKNVQALEYMVKLSGDFKYFWHQEDDYTLTSNGMIWTYPGKTITDKSILVLKDKEALPDSCTVFGVCSDYVKGMPN
jgi:hypothetical protein